MDQLFAGEGVVLALHDEQMAEHGGAGGVRDIWLRDSALARLPELDSPGQSHAAALAAIHAFGIAWSPPGFAGNERTAIALVELFLWLNCNAQNA
jgi:death-on-curing protein